MDKKEGILKDLEIIQKYMIDYPSVRGGEAANWASTINALGSIHKSIKDEFYVTEVEDAI